MALPAVDSMWRYTGMESMEVSGHGGNADRNSTTGVKDIARYKYASKR